MTDEHDNHQMLKALAQQYRVQVMTQQEPVRLPTFTREELVEFLMSVDQPSRTIDITSVRPRGTRLRPITAENQEIMPPLGTAYVRPVKS